MMTGNFFWGVIQTRRQLSSTFKILKKKNCQLRIVYPANIYKNQRQNKDFFITSPPRMLYPAKLSSRCEGENTDYPKQISLGSSSVLDLPYKM